MGRSLLSTASDDADPDPVHVVALLDATEGAYERARLGLKQADEGASIPLADL